MKRYIRSESTKTLDKKQMSAHAQKIAATADHYIAKYKKAMKVLAQ